MMVVQKGYPKETHESDKNNTTDESDKKYQNYIW